MKILEYHDKVTAVMPEDTESALRVLGMVATRLFHSIPEEHRQEELVNWVAKLIEVETRMLIEDEEMRISRRMH